MKIKKYESEREWLVELVKETMVYLIETGEIKEKIFIGLAGGQTPGEFYREIGENESLPWNKMKFVLIDERYVPRDKENSNFNMVVKTLFKNVVDQRYLDKLIFFKTELEINESKNDFLKQLDNFGCEELDFCFLGIGTDAHFASLFPGTNLTSNDKVLITKTEAYPEKDRLTLSANFLMKTKKIIVFMKGPEKKEMMRKFEEKDFRENEAASLLLKHPDCTIYYCN